MSNHRQRFVAWLIRVNNVIRTGGLSMRRQDNGK